MLWRILCIRKMSLERTKQTVDMYYTVRNLIPEFFRNRDPVILQEQEVFTYFAGSKSGEGEKGGALFGNALTYSGRDFKSRATRLTVDFTALSLARNGSAHVDRLLFSFLGWGRLEA
uniref:Uncharacterized protein n=1 Tax=Timema douglasi TaxID=61478 RepID=A0A7R8VXK5_TIMDO|nr:unnamed protein product [Timema douglasi]